jgi:Arc/MetJ family transcription regulator
MATNLAIDDNLIDEARRVGNHSTKREAVTVALQEYVARHAQVNLQGKTPSNPAAWATWSKKVQLVDPPFSGGIGFPPMPQKTNAGPSTALRSG